MMQEANSLPDDPPPSSHRCGEIRSARMPPAPLTPRELVERLDARHEELIQKLDELNARIEATLADFVKGRGVEQGDEPLAA